MHGKSQIMHTVFLFDVGLVTLITLIAITGAAKYNFKGFQRGASEIFSIWRKSKIISNNKFTNDLSPALDSYTSSSTFGNYNWKPYEWSLGDSSYFPKITPSKIPQYLFPFGWNVNKIGSQSDKSEKGVNSFTGLNSMPIGWNIGGKPNIFSNFNNPFKDYKSIAAPSPFLTEGNSYMKSSTKFDIKGLRSVGKSIINSIVTNYIKNNVNKILRTDEDSRQAAELSNEYENGTKVIQSDALNLKEAEKMKELQHKNSSKKFSLNLGDSFHIELKNNEFLLTNRQISELFKSVAVNLRRKDNQEIVLVLILLWFL